MLCASFVVQGSQRKLGSNTSMLRTNRIELWDSTSHNNTINEGWSETLHYITIHHIIKGPDNPTSQLLPIMIYKCCRGTGKEGKTKDVMDDREVKQVVCEELCVWQSGMWKIACDKENPGDKVVCERWCVWKLCAKESMWQSCVWKMVCDKAVRETWCGKRGCVQNIT